MFNHVVTPEAPLTREAKAEDWIDEGGSSRHAVHKEPVSRDENPMLMVRVTRYRYCPGVAVLTLREIADTHGYSLKYVRSLSTKAEDWPGPVGRRRQPRGPGTYAYVYDADEVAAWVRRHRLGGEQWTMDRIAAEFGVTVEMVMSARKRGQLPVADGVQLGRPWWHPSTARGWWFARQVPDGAWRIADIGDQIGVARPQARLDLPPPDGLTGRVRWWWPNTIRTWWAPQLARQLERAQARVDAEKVAAAVSADRWFSRDVAVRTGLSYESVRTYRRLGKLPEPDGVVNGRPWWRPNTIRLWDRRSTSGRPRRSTPIDG